VRRDENAVTTMSGEAADSMPKMQMCAVQKCKEQSQKCKCAVQKCKCAVQKCKSVISRILLAQLHKTPFFGTEAILSYREAIRTYCAASASPEVWMSSSFGKIRPAALFCVAIILVGAALITLPGLKGGSIDLRGLAWVLPSPLIYVLYLAANSVLLRRHKPLVGAVSLYLGMALTFGATCVVQGLDMPREPDTWLLLIFVALGPGAAVITLFSYSVPRLGPSSYAIIANMELVTVLAVGVTLLGEPVTPERVAGGGLILAGIVGYGLLRKPQATPAETQPVRAVLSTRERASP
jgi:multidrug transporter EmrE-like cation transporter